MDERVMGETGGRSSRKTMRVLHVMTRLPVGGVEGQLLSVLNHYDRRRIEPFVCCLSDVGETGREISRAGFEVIALGRLGHRFDVRIVRDLVKLMRERQCTVVRTHQYHANLYGRLAAWRAGVQCIVASVHNVYTRRGKLHRRYINQWLGKVSDRVVAVSHAVRDDILRWDRLPEKKVCVIHNGVDTEALAQGDRNRIRRELDIPLDGLVVGTVGRLAEQKGQRYLLEAAVRLKASVPGVHVLIAGDGPLRKELENLAHRLRLGECVTFLGTRRDIPDVLAALDVFVLPSLWEGLGIALIEAMAAGCPVVATDILPFREVMGDHASLVPCRDGEALGLALETLLQDPVRRELAGRSARQRARDMFDIRGTVERYVTLFDEVLADKGFGENP
jgi:glycosyltransferase involved in cell wall biosynthesis